MRYPIQGLCLTLCTDIGGGVKIQLFQKNLMLHIKLKGITNSEAQSPLPNSLTPPPDPWVGVKGQNSFFQNKVMLHIKLKKITNAATWKKIFCPQTPPPPPPTTRPSGWGQ